MKVIQLVVGAIRTNCYIVYNDNTLTGVVIDPGDDSNEILKTVDENRILIKYVLLTHGHVDHILAVNDICEKTGAKLVIHKNDVSYLDEKIVKSYGIFSKNPYTEKSVDIFAEDGTIITVDSLNFEYLNTPGHTPGSSVIKVENCLFTGDTLFKHECGRCDLPGGDFSQMLQSLKRLSEIFGDYNILPGHEALSTLDDERKNNAYMKQANGK